MNNAYLQPCIQRDPIMNVFNAIQKYSTMAEAQGNPETNGQIISIGMMIIRNARIFTDKVEKWNNKFDADKTWPQLKTYFTDAKYNYKISRPRDTAESLGYHNQKINVFKEVLQQLDQHN